MKKKLLLCLLLVAITGCDDDHRVELTNEEKIANLEASGKLPVLDRSDDLLGPDEDNNGVRDDIDAYIDRVYTQPEQHAAVMQIARVMQKKMTVDITDNIAIKKQHVEYGRAINCAAEQFKLTEGTYSSAVPRELRAMTTNTKKRLLASLAVSKASDGMVLSLASGDTCE